MAVGGGDPLLERGEELDALRLHLARVSRDGGLAVIAGAAGIGKTRLLRAVHAEAGDLGLRVLTARCSALERDFAFGVARQVFEPRSTGRRRPQRRSSPARRRRPATRHRTRPTPCWTGCTAWRWPWAATAQPC